MLAGLTASATLVRSVTAWYLVTVGLSDWNLDWFEFTAKRQLLEVNKVHLVLSDQRTVARQLIPQQGEVSFPLPRSNYLRHDCKGRSVTFRRERIAHRLGRVVEVKPR